MQTHSTDAQGAPPVWKADTSANKHSIESDRSFPDASPKNQATDIRSITKFVIGTILQHSTIWIILAVATIFAVAYIVGMRVTAPTIAETSGVSVLTVLDSSVHWPDALLDLARPSKLVRLLGSVFVASMLGLFQQWRLMHMLLASGFRRTSVILGCMIALLLGLILIAIAPMLVGALTTFLVTMLDQGQAPAPDVRLLLLILFVATNSVISFLPYAALGMLVAVATGQRTPAVMTALLFDLLIEPMLKSLATMVGSPFTWIHRFLPSGLSYNFMLPNDMQDVIPLSPEVVPLLQLAWTVLLASITIWIIRRKDFTQAIADA